MRLGEFRRYAGRSPKAPEIPGQIVVPRELDYPDGLVFFPAPGPLIISDLVIFRGADVEPPQRVAGEQLLAETNRLEARLSVTDIKGRDVGIVAVDLYDNASAAAKISR